MFTQSIGTDSYPDLGATWIRHQTARLRQTYLQFGGHFRVDVGSLVDRTARQARWIKRGIDA